MKNLKVFLASIALCMFLVSCGGNSGNNSTSEIDSNESISQESESQTESVEIQEGVLAHWKFQNSKEYYSGSVENDDLTFYDLSGHGNDLITVSEGNGDQLDIFEWDEEGAFGGAPALKMNNTLAKAQSVDTYDPSQTSYSGAYVSGKYLKTVDNAPLNAVNGNDGWTIEIIFKVSEEWNNSYNRYVGVFSKQGVSKVEDEPVFAMMVTCAYDERNGALNYDGTTGVQYVHINRNEQEYKSEYKNGEIYAGEWVHFMVASDGNVTYLYLNGEQIDKISGDNTLSNSSMGSWEVGVGRKYGEDAKTMNTKYTEGLIRRLFCGTISEIRFSKGQLAITDSLIFNK